MGRLPCLKNELAGATPKYRVCLRHTHIMRIYLYAYSFLHSVGAHCSTYSGSYALIRVFPQMFDVQLNEHVILSNLDIFARSGGHGVAWDEFIPFTLQGTSDVGGPRCHGSLFQRTHSWSERALYSFMCVLLAKCLSERSERTRCQQCNLSMSSFRSYSQIRPM